MGRKPIPRRIARIIIDGTSSNPQIFECDRRGRPIHQFPKFQRYRLEVLGNGPSKIYKNLSIPSLGEINPDVLTVSCEFDVPPADGRMAGESGDPAVFEGFATDDFEENLVVDESASEEEEWAFCVVQPDGLTTE
jgi:hypothetical protein